MLLIKDLIRLSSQHRTLYCYLLLWILLIIIGMYKYVSSDIGINILATKSFYINNQQQQQQQQQVEYESHKRHQMEEFHQLFCNEIEGLVPAEEGGLIEGWTLQGNVWFDVTTRVNTKGETLIDLSHGLFRSSFDNSTRRQSITQSCAR